MKRTILLVLVALAALISVPVASAGWEGNTFIGDNGQNSATGNEFANTFWMYGAIDFSYGGGGNDLIRAGKGDDVSREEGGYGTIWACGQSDKCDGNPGNDWMIAGSGGAQINAGQAPAVKQYIVCSVADFDEVYRDSADWFMLPDGKGGYKHVTPSESKCDNRHNVSSVSVDPELG